MEREVESAYGHLRCLPYFFLIGFPKCATTDLYDRIAKHPHVVRSKKEIHWFTRLRHSKGET